MLNRIQLAGIDLEFRRLKIVDFDLRNEARERPPQKFEDSLQALLDELPALLDADNTRSQKQMAEIFNVDQSTISDRLKAMGKIQKDEQWNSRLVVLELTLAKTTLLNFCYKLRRKKRFEKYMFL